MVQPDLKFMSPPDKEEFLLPQSLSEALTLEMKQTNRRKSGEFLPRLSETEKQGDDKIRKNMQTYDSQSLSCLPIFTGN